MTRFLFWMVVAVCLVLGSVGIFFWMLWHLLSMALPVAVLLLGGGFVLMLILLFTRKSS